MTAVAFPRIFARGLPAAPPVAGAPTVLSQPISATAVHGTLVIVGAVFGGGTLPISTGLQFLDSQGQWVQSLAYIPDDTYPVDVAVGQTGFSSAPGNQVPLVNTYRFWAQSAGSTERTYTASFTLTHTPAPAGGTPSSGSFGGPGDYVYPTVPTVGSTTAAGQLVVEVSTAAQLAAAIGNNRYIILNDGNYWTGSTWIISGRNNLTLRARNRHGARFAASSYGNVNGIHFSLCDDLQLIGLDFAKTGYYSVRIGADNLNYGSSPFGPCRRVKFLGCRFDDLTTGAIKLDSGYGNGSASPYVTSDVEIGWCQISRTGQAPPSTNLDFSEGIYMGDGTYPYYNRVDNVNIHHCLIDGTSMLTGSGEAIEAKVYCSNIRIADTEIKNWQLADSTSGGAIALSINRGTNISPNHTPVDNGVNGYLVERCFIHGTRLRSGTIYAKGSAISLGHGNSIIRNNVLANNVSGGLIFVNHSATHTGIFSNPAQLDVLVLHNTIVGNGSLGNYGVNWQAELDGSGDPVDPSVYFARVTSRNNLLSGGASYPAAQGVTWVQQQDAWGATAGQMVAGNFTTDDVTLLRPTSDSTFVSGTDVGLTTDLLGNPRPSGQRQFGAIEVQV